MEDPLISIKEELGCEEFNASRFEIIVHNVKDRKSVGIIKIQFQVNEYQLFQTEHQTCLFCNETYKSSEDAKAHMLLHTQRPFTCDLFDFQFFLKWSIKLNKSDQEKTVLSNETRDKDEVREVPVKEKTNTLISDCAVSPQDVSSASQTSSIVLEDLKTQNHLTGNQLYTYSCVLCSFKTSDAVVMANHKNLIHRPQKTNSVPVILQEHNCTICGYKAKSRAAFRTHLHLHKKFSCDLCDFKSIRPSALKKHKLIHDVNQELQVIEKNVTNLCPLCDYIAPTKNNFELHFRSHIGDLSYACTLWPLCDFRATCQSSLQNHMTLIHYDRKSYVCETCKVDCKNNKEYTLHLKIHKTEPRFQCDICGSVLRSKATLDSHIRIHTGEKPYKCAVCDYRSSSRTGLNAHKKIHGDVKPYLCDKCNYKTFLLQKLNHHMLIHNGEKTVKCSMCEFKCYDKSRLRKHMRIHTGEKPFACEFCKYKSSLSGNLHTHVRGVHRINIQVRCANCSFKCYLKSNLEEHMKIHSRSQGKEAL